MSWVVATVVNRGWGPKMFFESIPTCSPRFSNVFLRVLYMWAFEFVDYTTLLKFVVPVFGCHEESFYSVGPFEGYLYSLVVAYPFKIFPLVPTCMEPLWRCPCHCCFCCCFHYCCCCCCCCCWVGCPWNLVHS